ncbi:MAG: ATP-dependent DNA ligase [Nitrososphaerota archaeon]|jgi:DNA ligase-1|nr:ATP-dependent DNA ligase [Nitrososphaerota archaeon]MDG6930617.1 ATP-dependent DNA ligase [Nitrososphaerota archaeon]MDG6932758.1 ATP-dependent DNA ligase [Nitrososphaerota archaeon]MDG6935853.1 ATP-dependent DNA ligase [Nitrososphaerota archaeon]MDG6944174.1 ATP-dependent DNA ligase [Nitrososphaerota archaeon]
METAFKVLVDHFKDMEDTSKRKELTSILAHLFNSISVQEIDKVVYLTQGKLYPDYMGIELGVAEKTIVKAISKYSGIAEGKIMEEYRKTGDLGDAVRNVVKGKRQMSFFSEPLTIVRVYSTLDRIARSSGKGSQEMKLSHILSLLNDADPEEARYLVKIVLGTLRLGVADYTVLDALAFARSGTKDSREMLERAYNLSGDLGLVAATLMKDGEGAVKAIGINIGRPVRPMLAERVPDIKGALEYMENGCTAEYKYDGERVQIHKSGKSVTLFSRRLENITMHYPDIVKSSLNSIAVEEAIVEGEAVAVDQNTGEFFPFQELMHRRRKYGIQEAMELYPVTLFLFDMMLVNGKQLIDLPLAERRKIMQKSVKSDEKVQFATHIETKEPAKLEVFMDQAITDGCEGLMLKDMASAYRAGARGFSWIKLKRDYQGELGDTLDLVVVGAFYGRGRRAGAYGTLLTAVYDPDSDSFYTVSKVGAGLTDQDLATFPKLLDPHRISHRHARVYSNLEADAWFEPRVVIEVQVQEITLSPIHTAAFNAIKEGAGLALRFPRFTGKVRDDKGPEDATTVKELVEMYGNQKKKSLTSGTGP